MDYDLLKAQIQSFAEADGWYVPLMANAAALLFEALADVNWAGFYHFLCTEPEVCSSIQTVTVGPGVSPSQPPKRVADFTASRDFHPAPKNIVVIKLHVYYISPRSFCKEQTGKKQGASGETEPGKTSCL